MVKYFRVLFFLVLGLLCFSGFSQNLNLEFKSETIKILKDSSYINEVSVEFSNNDLPRIFPIFYDSELEKVNNIHLYEKKGKRLKKISLGSIPEENVDLDYSTSKKIKSIIIPEKKDIKLTYSVKCNELMYFSNLPLFSYDNIDTLAYTIQIPKDFKFNHNIINSDSLAFFSIDSTANENVSIWNIKVSPKKVEPDPLQFFGIYKNIKVPFIRTLVIPKSYNKAPINYMNDWYYNKTLLKKGLSTEAQQKIDELTLNVKSESEVIDIIYEYVKKNFKYVAIEIGMGAFIPSTANDVFLNKQGDCKDLSNFLSEALAYKGIKSDLALAATFDHISDCDFPSLCSANHVVCVAYLNDEKIILDPTDPEHAKGTPVQSLQGRTILIVSEDGGSFYEVERFSTKQNNINYELNLNISLETDIINGLVEVSYNGISDNYLRHFYNTMDKKSFTEYVNAFFEEVLGNQELTGISYTDVSQNLNFKGDILIQGKTFSDTNNRYLFLDFLPRLFENIERETLIEGIYIGNNFEKTLTANINLNESVEKIETIKHNFETEGVSLFVEIVSVSDKEIQCKYKFVFDYIIVNNKNLEKINKILNAFKNILNDPIVLKKTEN